MNAKICSITTPLGSMIAIADDESLYLLEFADRKGLERQLKKLSKHGYIFNAGRSAILTSIDKELQDYFSGTLKTFKTPYQVFGSDFQLQAWKKLSQIPYGQTCSYAQQALSFGKPLAVRATANANAANKLALVIPCHRVIASNGGLGGYAAGLKIKQWLLDHEKKFSCFS